MSWPLVADESVDVAIIAALRVAGYTLRAIVEEHAGWSDDQVVSYAFEENSYLITEDKDFGELTYRLKKPNHGILLLRLPHLLGPAKAALVLDVFERFAPRLANAFSVLDAAGLRIKPYQ